MEKRELTDRGKKILGIVAIVIFVLFMAAMMIIVGKPLVKFASEPEKFREWIDSMGFVGKLAFIGMMALQVVVALIPGEPLEIGAGYAFGAWEGTLLCEIGAAIGTVIVYLFVKRFGRKVLEIFFPVDKINSMRFLQNTNRLYLITGIVFFIPGTPKDLITYFIGLTNMKLLPLVLISFFARVPSVITSTIGGSALNEKNYTFAIIVFVATLIISGIGILIYRAIAKKEDARGEKKAIDGAKDENSGFRP